MRTHYYLNNALLLMKRKTEELLYLLGWSCDLFLRPTFRNLTGSFEEWVYANGLRLQLARLEQQKLIERRGASGAGRVYRLTAAGLLHMHAGRSPKLLWDRPWDRKWRMVLFDFPNTKHAARNRLRAHLRRCRFGYLQKSVWITPDPMPSVDEFGAGGGVDVESLILLEARPCAGQTDEEIVTGAWDFPYINSRYEEYLKVLKERPDGNLHNVIAAKAFRRWIQHERQAWTEALAADPLLPEKLLPQGYLGCTAWQQRGISLPHAAKQMREFKL